MFTNDTQPIDSNFQVGRSAPLSVGKSPTLKSKSETEESEGNIMMKFRTNDYVCMLPKYAQDRIERAVVDLGYYGETVQNVMDERICNIQSEELDVITILQEMGIEVK